MSKSLNQLWKESGTTLSYKEWRQREDSKMASFDGISVREQLLKDESYQETRKQLLAPTGYQKDISGKTIAGIPNRVFLIAGGIILLASAYVIYKKYKK